MVETLAVRRAALGISTRQLAALAGVDHVTLWRWERGDHRPNRSLARAVEATLSALEAAQEEATA